MLYVFAEPELFIVAEQIAPENEIKAWASLVFVL